MSKTIGSLSVCGAAMFLSLLVSSAFGYEKEIEELSAQMAEKIAGKGKKTVAVVDFTDLQGNVTELGRFLAEELSGSLSKGERGFEVVNRSNLKQLIQEYKLFSTGVIDQKAAMKLGEFSGIEALITGTITPFTENIRVSTSVLDIKTAKAIDNERENIPRTKDINELLEKAIAAPATEEGKATKITDSKPAQKKDKADGGAFSDDFNAGPKPDWKPVSGNWTMSNGQYTVTDINNEEMYTTFIDGKKWSNFTMEVDVEPGYASRFGEELCDLNICPRMISSKEKICFGMQGRDYKFNEAYWYIVKDGSKGEPTSTVSLETSEGKPVHVKIEVKNGVFTSYVNGTQVNQIYDHSFSMGSIGLSQWYKRWDGKKIRMAFDNLEIKPLAD
ncbi:MAG: FlgO family outer membrane protein [Candidatus Electronema sp. VV]